MVTQFEKILNDQNSFSQVEVDLVFQCYTVYAIPSISKFSTCVGMLRVIPNDGIGIDSINTVIYISSAHMMHQTIRIPDMTPKKL